MPIYWSMLIVTLVTSVLSYGTKKKTIMQEGNIVKKTQVGFAIFTFAFIVFFIGLRDDVLDTYWYIASFKATPTNIHGILLYAQRQKSGLLFFIIQGLFKLLVSDNYYIWLLFIASVSCICLGKILYKYSIDFPLTAYLFVAEGSFTWLLNGVRQFIVVCFLFAFTDWLIEGKKSRYILLAIILTFVHTSAVFLVPVCLFVSSKKILGKKMIWFAVITVIATYFSERVIGVISNGLGRDYSIALASGTGSNVLRLLVACVPIIITLISLKLVEKKAPPSIILAINMSFIGDCFYLSSTFSNGILVGRMPIYFTIYNLYLLPWLIKKCFTKDSSKLLYFLCVCFYCIYFYYQMHIAWDGLIYESEILNLYFQ